MCTPGRSAQRPQRSWTRPCSRGDASKVPPPWPRAPVLATGMTLADLKKPQVGIGTVWYESNPCNMHLLDLAAAVKEGVQGEGLVGLRFSTVGVSDGISMGTAGMAYSLPSRDLIADSFETVRPSAPAAAWTQSTEPAPTRAAAGRAHADRGRALLRRHGRAARLRQEHAGLRPGHVAFEPVRPGGVKLPRSCTQTSRYGLHGPVARAGLP